MKGIFSGGGKRSFPFLISFLLSLTLLLINFGIFYPINAQAQNREKRNISFFDRLAEEATLLNKRAQFDQVISLLQAHKDNPQNDSALFFNELGFAYRQKGKLTEAIQAYAQALARDPKNPVIMNNMGYVFYLKKEYQQAIERFQQALHLAPMFKEAHSNLALAYYQIQKFSEALEEIEIVLKLDPNHDQARKFREKILKKIREEKKIK